MRIFPSKAIIVRLLHSWRWVRFEYSRLNIAEHFGTLERDPEPPKRREASSPPGVMKTVGSFCIFRDARTVWNTNAKPFATETQRAQRNELDGHFSVLSVSLWRMMFFPVTGDVARIGTNLRNTEYVTHSRRRR